jgi:hypothetical protein
MSTSWDVRRHADGCIDIEFYRRRANRRQRLVRRLAFRKAVARIHKVKNAVRAFAQLLGSGETISDSTIRENNYKLQREVGRRPPG